MAKPPTREAQRNHDKNVVAPSSRLCRPPPQTHHKSQSPASTPLHPPPSPPSANTPQLNSTGTPHLRSLYSVTTPVVLCAVHVQTALRGGLLGLRGCTAGDPVPCCGTRRPAPADESPIHGVRGRTAEAARTHTRPRGGHHRPRHFVRHRTVSTAEPTLTAPLWPPSTATLMAGWWEGRPASPQARLQPGVGCKRGWRCNPTSTARGCYAPVWLA